MIRLLTVIGHGTDLLPHFIDHYQQHVDEINIVVYVSDIAINLENEVKDIIKNYDRVSIVKVVRERVFDWNKVTTLYNFMKYKKPNDWWVIADIDEFHLYPNDNLKKLITDCEENGWELVRGGFIDRIGQDGTFPELDETFIWKQFPNAGFFRYPMSNACPNKICVVKGEIEITSGQHYGKINTHVTWGWQGWSHPLIAPYETHSVQVHHFKWDKTSIERIKAVADVKQDYAFSNEYEIMYSKLLKTRFKINLDNPDYMFELDLIYPEYNRYKNWNKLIKKIVSI
jgi:hypothetical protein